MPVSYTHLDVYKRQISYQSGTSEQYLGRAIRDFAKRDDVVVATKFLPRTNEEIAEGISGQEHIRRMLDRSLQNLGTDYVDLYIYHMWDYRTPLCDIMEGLNNAVTVSYTHLDVYKRQLSIMEGALFYLKSY